jgi:hypothetical protein
MHAFCALSVIAFASNWIPEDVLMKSPITLMAVGLDAPDWDRDFFPEDLPKDWRLGYYANEFPGILIPSSTLNEAWEAEDWLDDVPEAFEFYFLLSAELSDGALASCIHAAEALDDRLKGLLLEAEDDQGYSDLLDRLASMIPGRSLSVMSHYQELPRCWRPDIEAGTRCGPGLLELDGEAPPKQLREYIEAFALATEAEEPILFVRAPVTAMETMNTLLDLMGL